MLAEVQINSEQLDPKRRVYVVETEDGDPELFQLTRHDIGRESGRYYLDRVHKDGPKVIHLEEGSDETWTVTDVQGDFKWCRHGMWVYDRIERNEWQPLIRVS